MVIELTEDNFAKVLAENKVVMVKFWAPWCGPCKAYGELFERVAADYPKMIWAQLNADDFPDVAVQYGVGGIPMTMCFEDEIIYGQEMGATTEGRVRGMVPDYVNDPDFVNSKI